MHASRSQRWALWIIIAAFSAPLVIIAFGSIYTRYIADDYCMKSFSTQLGLWNFIVFVYTSWVGTFSGLVFQGLMPSPQLLFIPIFGIFALHILLLYFSVRRLAAQLTLAAESLSGITLTFLLYGVFLCSLPSLHQSIFWYTANIPYNLPLAIAMLHVIWLGRLKGPWAALLFFWLNFILSGFNPSFTVVQFLWLSVLAVFTFQNKSLRWQVLFSLLGGLIGFGVVSIAPGNAVRLSLEPTVFDWGKALSLVPKALEVWLSYALNVPLGLLALLVIPVLFAYYFGKPLSLKIVLISLGLILLLTVSSAMLSLMPRFYIYALFPALRGWTIPMWILVCGLAMCGYLIGLLVRGNKPPLGYLPLPAQLGAILIALAFALNGAPIALSAVERQAAYAAAWDERDAYLRTFSGSTQLVYARSFDGTFDQDDLNDDPSYWVNVCIASYHNLSGVAANDQPPFVLPNR